MVFQKSYNASSSTDEEDKSLAYDLRQRYAKLVGDHLERVAYYRSEGSYNDYFKALEDLHTVTKHKFKDDKEEKTKKDSKKEPKDDEIKEDKYTTTYRKNILSISNQYSQEWLGHNNDSNGKAEIENSLREAEKYLYFKMDEAKMFGSGFVDEGL